jgi:hypothetical protein
MPKQIRAVILCEDKQQEVFARTFLTTCGIRILRVQINPDPGKGSGEQYVRRNYPKEVKAFRTNYSAQPDTRLVVMIDADTHSVEKRCQEMDRLLQEAGMPARQPAERIGVFIPRRNIETWIYFLQGQSVDEEAAYPKFRKNESVCKPYVTTLAQNYRQPLSDHAPASLKAACRETARIFPEAG